MKFKKGDRVAIYCEDGRFTGCVYDIKGEKVKALCDGESIYGWYHPKQLRRLKKKKRREWCIELHEPGCVVAGLVCASGRSTDIDGCSCVSVKLVWVQEVRR